jgi:four helix bundle protein
LGAAALPGRVINKLDEALGEAMESQAWLDHALDCGYIKAEDFRKQDAAWQSVGAMLMAMMNRADDFFKTRR